MRYTGIEADTGRAVALETADGHIAGMESVAPAPDMPWMSRGFVDIQVNGYRGIDYSGPGLETGDVGRLVDMLAAAGTTRHVPTIITNPRERILRNLATIANAVAGDPRLRAAIPGIHVEGPFISGEDGPRGAHDGRFVRDPGTGELDEWIDASTGLLRIVTVAPEREGAIEFIREATRRGVVAAIGHTAASGELIARAVEAGARLSTHLGNGSHPTLPRLRNYLWEQLADDRLTAGVIADGFHLPDSVLLVFSRAKGLDRIVLASDVSFLGGTGPGVRRWGDVEVEVHADGHIGLRGTTLLAGAGHLLDRDIAHFARAARVRIGDAVALATANPRHLLGLEPSGPGFRPGEPVDLVRFTYDPGPAGGPLGIVDAAFHGRTYP